MEIINEQALSECIRDAVRAELREHFRTGSNQLPKEEQLLSKQELADELGISLVTLTVYISVIPGQAYRLKMGQSYR